MIGGMLLRLSKVRCPTQLRCFAHEPSLTSSLKFLRKTPWARAKVEGLYQFMLHEQRRHEQRKPA